MTYRLIVNNTSTEEIIKKIIALPKRKAFRGIFSVFDSLDGKTVEITFTVDSLSVNITELEKKLNEGVISSESNILYWEKLD